MDRVFKSKVGWWYHLVLLVMVASTVFAFVGGKSPVTMVMLLLFTLECIHMLLSTWYKITADGHLIASARSTVLYVDGQPVHTTCIRSVHSGEDGKYDVRLV